MSADAKFNPRCELKAILYNMRNVPPGETFLKYEDMALAFLDAQLRTARSDALEEAAAWHNEAVAHLKKSLANTPDNPLDLETQLTRHKLEAARLRALKEST